MLRVQHFRSYLWQVALDGVCLDHVLDSAGPLPPWQRWLGLGIVAHCELAMACDTYSLSFKVLEV